MRCNILPFPYGMDHYIIASCVGVGTDIGFKVRGAEISQKKKIHKNSQLHPFMLNLNIFF